MSSKNFFSGTQPCKNCPYRKDAPLQLWDKFEFEKLLQEDKKQFGGTYKCHKNNGSCCKGWLMDQDKRYFPNINLRLALTQNGITRTYLDKLKSRPPLYDNIKQMALANYPEIGTSFLNGTTKHKTMTITSNSAEGDKVLQHLQVSHSRSVDRCRQFETFIYGLGYTSWHIHDGWVGPLSKGGNYLENNEQISLIWIEGHAGYSHSKTKPKLGGTICIIKSSPHSILLDHRNPFDIYCYEATEMPKNFGTDKFILTRLEIKQAILNVKTMEYEPYTPKPKSYLPGALLFLMDRLGIKK